MHSGEATIDQRQRASVHKAELENKLGMEGKGSSSSSNERKSDAKKGDSAEGKHQDDDADDGGGDDLLSMMDGAGT